ncbi:MAG: hypothetical protein ACYDH6_13695 [Acidimicrobiales bacterium]
MSLALAVEKTLPIAPALDRLFPLGLHRGSTISVSATSLSQGSTTVAFSVAAAASMGGAWCAAVGFADLGLVAVAEMGIALERLVLVPQVAPNHWINVVGALLDAVDVVLVRPPPHLRQGDARRLISRTRERGTILIPVGRWTERADVRLEVTGSRWEGPGAGDGHLLRRQLEVRAAGRGAASRERRMLLDAG